MGLDSNINVGYQGYAPMHTGRPKCWIHERLVGIYVL